MENASKALIIVASVIISMVIVGLGVYFVGVAQNQKDSANGINDVEIKAANNKFEQYFGDHVDAATVRRLIKDVQLNNNRNVAHDIENRNITVTVGNASTDFVKNDSASEVLKNIKTGRYYKVGVINNKFNDDKEVSGYYKSGYLRGIKITENDGKNK